MGRNCLKGKGLKGLFLTCFACKTSVCTSADRLGPVTRQDCALSNGKGSVLVLLHTWSLKSHIFLMKSRGIWVVLWQIKQQNDAVACIRWQKCLVAPHQWESISFTCTPPPVINATAAQEQVVFGSVLCSFVVVTLYVLPAACLCFLHISHNQ